MKAARREGTPRRLGVVLLGSFAITIASFVASAWVANYKAQGLLDAAESIVTDAMPAVGHLIRLRTALRHRAYTAALASSFANGWAVFGVRVSLVPLFVANRKLGRQALAVLKPGQWSDLIARLRSLENPVVPTKPSKYALPAGKQRRASDAHTGE